LHYPARRFILPIVKQQTGAGTPTREAEKMAAAEISTTTKDTGLCFVTDARLLYPLPLLDLSKPEELRRFCQTELKLRLWKALELIAAVKPPYPGEVADGMDLLMNLAERVESALY
jgi:hypothetical protein